MNFMPSIRIYLLLVSLILGGCASTQGEINSRDPLEPYNRGMYKFNDALDKAILKPIAKGYNTVMPEPGKIMVTNFFSNLNDIVVTINDLLQLKFAQAASDGTRVLFNSTFGIFGLLNITDRLEKHNEDFGQTLGYWGVSSGPYVVLPFFGPSNFRDSVGLLGDSYVWPIRQVSNIPTRNTLYGIRTIDLRSGLLDQESILEEAAIDRYAFIRDGYMQHRKSLVYDGDPPREKFNDEFDDEFDEEYYEDENSDITDKNLIENSPPVTASTSDTQNSMEQLTQETSSNSSSSVPPTEIEVPSEPAFNPYRMEQLVPPNVENSLQN